MFKSKKITVKIRTVYGADLVYPVCEQAQQFAALSNTRTLTHRTIALIKSLGYTVQVLNTLPATL